MNQLVLAGCAPQVLLSHAALAGLGAIMEEAGVDPRLEWTTGKAPRPVVHGCSPAATATV